jgi:hypothetical protein
MVIQNENELNKVVQAVMFFQEENILKIKMFGGTILIILNT